MRLRRTSNRRRPERGAVAVEFALVFPFLALLIFGIIQYSLYFWAMQGGSAAAREAARSAAVGQPTSCPDFRDQVRTNIDAMESGDVQIRRTFDNTPVSIGDDVEIAVAFDSIDLGFPFVPFINGGRVSQSATARVDYVPDSAIGNCS